MVSGSPASAFQPSQQASRMAPQVSKTRLARWFRGRYCQMFPTGFSSGEYGGKGKRLTVSGTTRSPPGRCQPAPSGVMTGVMTAWAPGAAWDLISARCWVHCHDVDGWQHAGRADAACGTDRPEQTGGGVALIVWRPRPAAAPGPDTGQAALLADARVRRENSPPDCFLARLTLATRDRSACPGRARE